MDYWTFCVFAFVKVGGLTSRVLLNVGSWTSRRKRHPSSHWDIVLAEIFGEQRPET